MNIMALLVLLALHRKLDEDSIPVPRPGLAVDDADSWESTDKDELAEFVQTGMGRMRDQMSERFFPASANCTGHFMSACGWILQAKTSVCHCWAKTSMTKLNPCTLSI